MSESTITFNCPGCQASLTIGRDLAGISGPCPHCQLEIVAPEPHLGRPARRFSDPVAEIPAMLTSAAAQDSAPPAAQASAPPPAILPPAILPPRDLLSEAPGQTIQTAAPPSPRGATPPQQPTTDGIDRTSMHPAPAEAERLAALRGENAPLPSELYSGFSRPPQAAHETAAAPHPAPETFNSPTPDFLEKGAPVRPNRKGLPLAPVGIAAGLAIVGVAGWWFGFRGDDTTPVELGDSRSSTAGPEVEDIPSNTQIVSDPTPGIGATDESVISSEIASLERIESYPGPSLVSPDPFGGHPNIAPDVIKQSSSEPTEESVDDVVRELAANGSGDLKLAAPRKAVDDFLEAATLEARLAHTYRADEVKAEMEAYYSKNGETSYDLLTAVFLQPETFEDTGEEAFYYKIALKDQDRTFPLAVVKTESGHRVDWQRFVEFKDNKFEEFRTNPSAEPIGIFQVIVEKTYYLEEDVPNAAGMVCFKISCPWETEHSYAFADKSVALGRQLDSSFGFKKRYFPVMELQRIPMPNGDHYLKIKNVLAPNWLSLSSAAISSPPEKG